MIRKQASIFNLRLPDVELFSHAFFHRALSQKASDCGHALITVDMLSFQWFFHAGSGICRFSYEAKSGTIQAYGK